MNISVSLLPPFENLVTCLPDPGVGLAKKCNSPGGCDSPPGELYFMARVGLEKACQSVRLSVCRSVCRSVGPSFPPQTTRGGLA